MAETPPMPMCPMAKTCSGMMEKTSFGAFLMVPGLLFIATGVLIIFGPQDLFWLLAPASILFGVAMLRLETLRRGARARRRRGKG